MDTFFRVLVLFGVLGGCLCDSLEVDDLKNVISEDERRGAETITSLDTLPSKEGKSAKRGIFLNKGGSTGLGTQGTYGSGGYHGSSPGSSFYGSGGKHSYSTNFGDLGHSLPSNAGQYGPTGNAYLPPVIPTGHGHSGPGPSNEYLPAHGHGGIGLGHQYGVGGHNPLAWKGFLIPLAGIALLGAAAALSTNPVLLQLGVLNGKRRRRRDAARIRRSDMMPENPYVTPSIKTNDYYRN